MNDKSMTTDPYGALLAEAASRSQRYLRTIRERHVGVTQEALDRMSALGGSLHKGGEDPSTVLALLDDFGSPATMASMGPRFFGGVVGGALPVTVGAQWLATAWDQNACLYDFSPISAYLEDVVLGWLLELFNLPLNSGGAFVTGTQMADVTALAAARCFVLQRLGWDVAQNGLFGAPPIRVIVGDEVHATMLKALRVLGFGADQVYRVPTDAQGRIQPSQIPQLQAPVIVCVQAGNVNTGAFDPINEICSIAHEMDAWVHVDGAFGLWAAASPMRKHLVDGISQADSWATDAHKWLNVPQDSGIAIVREAAALQQAMMISAAYYPDPAPKREPMQWSPESSRRARAVEIWAALRHLGRDGVAALVERTCGHATQFAEGLRAAGYEVHNDVVLNQVLVSFRDDETTAKIVEDIQKEGTCWCGATVWKGRKAMRISVSSWATDDEDTNRSLETILAIARSQEP